MSLLGERLKELRGKRSFYQVGKACGIIPNDVSRYERGERVPTPPILERLSQYFEIPYAELRKSHYEDVLDTFNEKEAVFAWVADNLTPELLIEWGKRLPPEERKTVGEALLTSICSE